MRYSVTSTFVAFAIALIAISAQAQHAPHGSHTNGPEAAPSDTEASGPFGFAVHGAFRNMMQRQDFAAKVQLRTIIQGGATDAVGAVEGLRGEITAIDGKLLLSYGTPCASCVHPGQEHATLLASAKVPGWLPPIIVSADLSGQALDAFIMARAEAAGLDLAKPFPIRLTGALIDVKMHVVSAANPNFKGHGSGHPMAEQVVSVHAQLDGDVVGFYAPKSLQGIITHPGDPFHYHWVDAARTRTTHLDAFGVASGTRLLLPKQ